MTVAIAFFCAATATAAGLTPVKTRDRRIVKRWELTGSPRGIAVATDGTVYVGLSEPQSVVAIDPGTGKILKEVVLDFAEIASTKELVSMRIDTAKNRLIVAQGSDESVTILSLPNLAVTREIGLEGEMIRDAVPDPAGRFLYVLGNGVHIYDAAGDREIRFLKEVDAMAIATDSKGKLLAVVGSELFGSTRATVVALYETGTWRELAREPLQTDRRIQSALFAADDRALMVLARDWLAEKSIVSRPARTLSTDGDGTMRLRFSFGDFISSETICLPEKSGPQIATLGATSKTVVFAERRCSASGSFTASERKVSAASLYGVNAWAVAFHKPQEVVYVSDPGGYLTIYKTPSPGESQ